MKLSYLAYLVLGLLAAIAVVYFVSLDTPQPDQLPSPPKTADTRSADTDESVKAERLIETASADIASEPTGWMWHEDNVELAKAHYYVDENGELSLPNDVELSFSKKFTYFDNSVVQIDYRVVDPFGDATPAGVGQDYSIENFDSVLDRMLGGDRHAVDWAARALSLCRDLKNAGQPELFERKCGGFRDDMHLRLDDTVEYLAQSGDPWAMLQHAPRLGEMHKSEERRVYEDLWAMGYTAGLTGILNTTPDLSLLDYDAQIREYAYFYASYVLTTTYLDGVPHEEATQWQNDILERVDAHMDQLSVPARRQAELVSRDFLSSNPNCCISFTGSQ